MREPGNRGITGQQPLGINRSFHYLVLKRPRSALKLCIREHFRVDKRLCAAALECPKTLRCY